MAKEEEQNLISHSPVAKRGFSLFEWLRDNVLYSCCPNLIPLRNLLSSEINIGVPENGKKTLVLDIDETLIRSFAVERPNEYDFFVDVPDEGRMTRIFTLKRPGVDEFLKAVKEMYEVVFFTASTREYGNKVIDILSPDTPLDHRLFRDSCTYKSGFFIKNLNNINRELCNMIIVDNNPISFLLNTQNGIEVPSFFGDPDDCYLMDTLLGKLQKCAVADDVRDVIIMNEWD